MAHVYKLLACWDARPHGLEESAAALAALRDALAPLDDRFVPWFTDDDEPRVELRDADEFARYLRRHPEQWEHGRRAYHAWQASFTNGRPAGERVTTTAKVGITEPSGSVWFPNSFELLLVGPGRPDSFSHSETIVLLLRAVVKTFAPRWVSFAPAVFTPTFDEALDGLPTPAWLLYLGAVPPAAYEATNWSLSPFGGGALASTRVEWPSPENKEHLAMMAGMRQDLRQRGLLRPAVTPVPDP